MNIENTIASIHQWHAKARPAPGAKDFNVQLGCHFEEIVEMLECMEGYDEDSGRVIFDAYEAVKTLADLLKAGEIHCEILSGYRNDFLDSLGDQIVTATGVAHCAKMNVTEAVRRINTSNWSKYVNGEPLFDENGKVKKGPGYVKPDLEGCY